MKKIFLSLVISVYSIASIAQEVLQKANTIVISMPDSSRLHDKILKVFSEKDYSVKNPEKQITSIHTEAKTLKNSRVSLNAETKANEIYLTGNIVVVGQGNMRIEHKGAKGTPIAAAWEEIDKVAKAFGGKLTYVIK